MCLHDVLWSQLLGHSWLKSIFLLSNQNFVHKKPEHHVNANQVLQLVYLYKHSTIYMYFQKESKSDIVSHCNFCQLQSLHLLDYFLWARFCCIAILISFWFLRQTLALSLKTRTPFLTWGWATPEILRARHCTDRLPSHPAGRAFISDWSTNSFIIIVYEKYFFKIQSEFFSQSMTKSSTVIKLFVDQSEVSALPARCFNM